MENKPNTPTSQPLGHISPAQRLWQETGKLRAAQTKLPAVERIAAEKKADFDLASDRVANIKTALRKARGYRTSCAASVRAIERMTDGCAFPEEITAARLLALQLRLQACQLKEEQGAVELLEAETKLRHRQFDLDCARGVVKQLRKDIAMATGAKMQLLRQEHLRRLSKNQEEFNEEVDDEELLNLVV